MRPPNVKLAAAVLFASALLSGNLAAAEALKVGGTGSATEMMRQVGAKFTAASEVPIEVVPSLGSAGGIHALADRLLDIAVSARPLKAAEAANGLTQVAVLRTAFVLATTHTGARGLKAGDLAKIFAADKPTWPDGTPLRIVLRPRSETDNDLLGKMAAGMVEAIESARKRPEVPVAATDQDNADLAERTPDTMISTTLTQLTTENRKLLLTVPLDGVEPTLANFESGAYSFAKNLYFIIRTNSSPATQRFVEFLKSPQGVAALRATATLPGAQ